MVKRMFSVAAHWDEDAKVFYSDSDIIGLHIEAKSIDEFEQIMMELAPGLVIANHISKAELETSAPEELIPAILWQRPVIKAA